MQINRLKAECSIAFVQWVHVLFILTTGIVPGCFASVQSCKHISNMIQIVCSYLMVLRRYSKIVSKLISFVILEFPTYGILERNNAWIS